MDLAIEANRNSALFNTMQQALDVYNPLLHKARPTVVNQTKSRIRVQAAQFGNTFTSWNGRRTARFNLPRIGSLYDASLSVAFQIPGVEPTASERHLYGDRGYAKSTLTTGGLNNTQTTSNTARGRLDRVYADNLLGFNMISSYVVSSKSREIFRATGEYLLTRYSQMDNSMKRAVFESVTPVDLLSGNVDDMFYAPYITYQMAIPLFMFFNEHITNALDVNFSEEVHIDVEFRAPSELFYYGNIGDLARVQALTASGLVGHVQNLTRNQQEIGRIPWDQSTTEGSSWVLSTDGSENDAFIRQVRRGAASIGGTGSLTFGTANVAYHTNDVDSFGYGTTSVEGGPIETSTYLAMLATQQLHIQGLQSPWEPKHIRQLTPADQTPTIANGFLAATGEDLANSNNLNEEYYREASLVHSSTTFAYPDVDNNGESVVLHVEMNADYIIQDTDAYRALRAETFPQGTGFTSIVFNTSVERFSNLMASSTLSQNLLDTRAGGSFSDPDQSPSGINVGDSTRYVDLQLRDNHLVFATHFMVRKMSDFGGSRTTAASVTVPTYGRKVATKQLGASQIYTRCLPVHYFQVLAAGRVIYESNGETQLSLTQTSMYNGSVFDYGTKGDSGDNTMVNGSFNRSRVSPRPFDLYTINWGLGSSRLENTGCISLQNLNNPVLRIYFKPDAWAEHQAEQTSSGSSEAKTAAALGVQVDVIHEHFNVITINSGNGEITSGLNQ